MTSHRFLAATPSCAAAQALAGHIEPTPRTAPLPTCTRKRSCRCRWVEMSPTGHAEILADCIAAGAHIKTLAGLMHRYGLSAVVSDGKAHNGVPFVAIVAQGPWCDLAREIGEALVAEIAARKARARGN